MLEIFPLVIGFIFQLLTEKVVSHYHPCLLPQGQQREVGPLATKEGERTELRMNYCFLLALFSRCPLSVIFFRKASHQLAGASLAMVIMSFPPQAHFTKIGSDRQGDLLLLSSWEGIQSIISDTAIRLAL